jgi:hypothetical protein
LGHLIIGPIPFIFGPLPSPQPPKHEAQRGEVVIVLVAMIVVIMVGNRPLLSFVRIAISL